MAGSTAFQRARGKPYAETFRCPGGALCLDFCNSGQNARGPSGTEWIAGFPELIDWLEAAEAITRGQAARLRRAAAASPRAAAQVWGRAIKLREALFRALIAKAEGGARSEEHTSELQSRLHLVCRLLLEKKIRHKPHWPGSEALQPWGLRHRDAYAGRYRRRSPE